MAIYRAALKDVVRWGSSDESWLAAASSPEDRAAEEELKKGLKDQPGMTTNQIWECLHLSNEWNAYVKGRRAGDLSFELPIFHAFYRLKRKTDLVTCGRNPGTFKEPLYILKENIGINEWPNSGIGKNDARAYIIEKLIASLGVTYHVHIYATLSSGEFRHTRKQYKILLRLGLPRIMDAKIKVYEWTTRIFYDYGGYKWTTVNNFVFL